jgi:DNA-directed RNA polymerase specialized sigma subunit
MKKGLEEYGIKRIIGEILDHFRSMVLDILPRKVMGKEIGR